MNLMQLVRVQWDRFGAGALFALGALVLVLGWVGVSREALTALQIPYVISGGLGGIFLLGLGGVMWLSADLRDEWRKLDAIEASLRGTSTRAEVGPGPRDEWEDTAESDGWSAGADQQRFSPRPPTAAGKKENIDEEISGPKVTAGVNAPAFRSDGPWDGRQLRLLGAFNAAGLVLLVLAWIVSARTSELAHQIGWLNLGVVAVVLAAGADVLWLSSGRRSVVTRRRSVLVDIAPVERVETAATKRGVAAVGWFHLRGTSRVHRSGCLLIEGKPVVAVEPRSARAEGLRRCELCAGPAAGEQVQEGDRG